MKTINIDKVLKIMEDRRNSSKDQDLSIFYEKSKDDAYGECIQIIKDNIIEVTTIKNE